MVTDIDFADNTDVFLAVSDPTRRAILDTLRHGDLSAGDLAGRFPISRPAVSRHLKVLHKAGLLRQTRQSQSLRYSLAPAPLQAIDRWLQDYRVYWGARLHDLKRYVENGETSR